MAGDIKGLFFKYLIGSMLEDTAEYFFASTKQKIQGMTDDQWYSWDEFQQVAKEIGDKLGDVTTKGVGKRVIKQSKDVFIAQGYDSLEKLLRGYPEMFNANIQNVPVSQQVALLHYEQGKVEYNYPRGQPRALIEGYFTGFFLIYGTFFTSIDFANKGDYDHVTIRW